MSKIVDVIKYEGDNSTFIWKHPCEDFNSMTQLIVHESQEAVFFLNGQALDLFGPGRYTLETQNIPKLSGAIKHIAGGETPFHCEVYFINKTVQMAIKWGTDSKVRFLEPTYGVPLEIGASGEMNLTVTDSRKLLIKLVGTMNGIAWDDTKGGFTKSLSASFRPLISTAVKSNLPNCIRDNNLNILEIDMHLPSLSKVLKAEILPEFEEYGLTIPAFYVTTVVLPETDPNFKKIKELHTISLQTKMAQAEAEVKTAMIESEAAVKTAIAQSEATVTAAQREAILEQETTKTELERRETEREIIRAKSDAESGVIRAQAEAQAIRMSGLAEAEVMRAKGYTQKDVLQADVQKAYAEGIGNMEISGGGGGSVTGDMLGVGIGLAAAGVIGGQVGEMFKGFGIGDNQSQSQSQPQPTVQQPINIQCPACQSGVPAGSKFCLECGQKIEILADNEMICPVCKMKTNKGKFCMECGAALVAKCAQCGADLPNGAKFCLECGAKI